MSLGRTERRGIPVSPGIAIGPAYVLRRERIVIPESRIRPDQADHEIERLRLAFAQTRAKLEEIRRGMQGTGLVGFSAFLVACGTSGTGTPAASQPRATH